MPTRAKLPSPGNDSSVQKDQGIKACQSDTYIVLKNRLKGKLKKVANENSNNLQIHECTTTKLHTLQNLGFKALKIIKI